jgi:hypothetical protein
MFCALCLPPEQIATCSAPVSSSRTFRYNFSALSPSTAIRFMRCAPSSSRAVRSTNCAIHITRPLSLYSFSSLQRSAIPWNLIFCHSSVSFLWQNLPQSFLFHTAALYKALLFFLYCSTVRRCVLCSNFCRDNHNYRLANSMAFRNSTYYLISVQIILLTVHFVGHIQTYSSCSLLIALHPPFPSAQHPVLKHVLQTGMLFPSEKVPSTSTAGQTKFGLNTTKGQKQSR